VLIVVLAVVFCASAAVVFVRHSEIDDDDFWGGP
jgi:hypothetical protein